MRQHPTPEDEAAAPGGSHAPPSAASAYTIFSSRRDLSREMGTFIRAVPLRISVNGSSAGLHTHGLGRITHVFVSPVDIDDGDDDDDYYNYYDYDYYLSA